MIDVNIVIICKESLLLRRIEGSKLIRKGLFNVLDLFLRGRHICVAEREASIYTDIIEEFTLSDIFTTIFTTK